MQEVYIFFPYILMYIFMYKLILLPSFPLPSPGENKVMNVFSKLPLEVFVRYFSRSAGTNTNIGYRGRNLPLFTGGSSNLFPCCILHSFP